MRTLRFPEDCSPAKGDWRTSTDITISNVQKRDIYRSPGEPSWVAWAILWKERSGAVKLSFVEVTGDQTAWPPTYNFNSGDIQYYLKTLVSEDGAKTWTDTGWREDLDPLHQRNPDHHIRHVFELPDGTLVRNYCHTVEGLTSEQRDFIYDQDKEGGTGFPFSPGPLREFHQKFASIWTSINGGQSWKEIYLFPKDPVFFIAPIHPLRDGSIVALGSTYPFGCRSDMSLTHGALSESKDGGKTWSEPAVIARNDDLLNLQGISEECDFVELDDGRILVIWRVDAAGSSMRQLYLQRDSKGIWQAGPALINPAFPHSGYPCMWRAGDGTIFYYSHLMIMYSCDDGLSWGELPLGISYYGQLTEVSPGRMLAITQKNMGDCSYPWKNDASMKQTTFDYQRIGVARQDDTDCIGALAKLDVGQPSDFHITMELTTDAANGLAYQCDGQDYRFVALTTPANDFRLPTAQRGKEQKVFLVIGAVEGGQMRILRKVGVGTTIPGDWAELQVTRQADVLKAAVKLPNRSDWYWGPVYNCFKDQGAAPGGVALFTSKSTGAFRNLRFDPNAGEIRSKWRLFLEEEERPIALDAGRAD